MTDMPDTDRRGQEANSSQYEEIRAKAGAIRYLVERRPTGMRASSGVWLRGNVSALARDVVALTDRLRVQAEQIAALQEAAKKLIRWVVIVTRPVADYGPANDERCQVDARDLYYLMQTADLLREALALAEGCAAPADEEEK